MTEHSEFSHIISVSRIGEEEMRVSVNAPSEACLRIARRMNLPKVHRLCCQYYLQQEGQGVVLGRGDLTVEFTQVCVVSLEEFEETMRTSFEVRFVPEIKARQSSSDAIDSIDEIVYDGHSIDLGEAAVEQFALELDPYPRAPKWVSPQDGAFEEGENVILEEENKGQHSHYEEKKNPFAALAVLKENLKGE
ncbi:MAG: DUF177 domain-containing protein [Acetobacter sp.]|nr:DUF177 domain-containing protein [Acetobacter sp.]